MREVKKIIGYHLFYPDVLEGCIRTVKFFHVIDLLEVGWDRTE